jgi:ribosomal protein S18 acetylase RimI-like enzyme
MMQACDQVERWYRDRDLVPGFQIWNGTDASLIVELDRRGYRTVEGALVLSRRLTGGETSTAADKGDARLVSSRHVATNAVPTAQFFELVVEADRLHELLDSSLPKCFVTLSDGSGCLLGGGAGVLDNDQLGIFSMTTLVAARRLGVARRILDELTDWGIAGGATASWLQVMASNVPATRLYASAGFERAHEYHYRLAAADCS